ncbi:hypothetical protein Nepgr_011474 [Nepenthes gracilis]|uniref:Secreted protein n=1 Tax=Nepenthes gracilis TaxID=150966 RepID=A0AAD3SE94_NEPGR|nr:hypothetical protein Nepgr_011474 [Nepenthes gracilis]
MFMASCSSPALKMTLLLMATLLLQQQFVFMEASRPRGIFAPPTPRPALVKPPSVAAFTVNCRKMMETEAFRPTTPGRSPGVGHEEPPGAR